MTDYTATPGQWADVEDWAANNGTSHACILELRARVEALEADQQPQNKLDRLIAQIRDSAMTELRAPTTEARPGGLVQRVAEAVRDAPHPIGDWTPEARAAIFKVARWLRSKGCPTAAELLEQEANR